jgi:cytochrome c-type biogenesis protein CcmH
VPSLGRAFLVALLACLACGPLRANEARPMAEDPVLEAQVMRVAEELRCLVCQNETIAASHADLAVDLRKQIRLKLKEGQSEAQILDFMVQRYGDFVRYRPPLKASTWLLWAGPFVLLGVAALVLLFNIRKHRHALRTPVLRAEESERARQWLGDETMPPVGGAPRPGDRRDA